MADTVSTYTVRIHEEPGRDLWAEVDELPGCFASGRHLGELFEALTEAIGIWLGEWATAEVNADPELRAVLAAPLDGTDYGPVPEPAGYADLAASETAEEAAERREIARRRRPPWAHED